METGADPGPTRWSSSEERAYRDPYRNPHGNPQHDARLDTAAGGPLDQQATLTLGLVAPGFGNAHSHAFHRMLRGRTHDGGGDFWQWRKSMYAAADILDPGRYREVATGVFSEMVACGYTAVGEFHYVHHRPDGTPYDPAHGMELALADAAEAAGIRLVLLDTCYLAGGIGRAPEPSQRRFSDGSASAWLTRWTHLREALAGRPLVTLGAAIHSVRAVPREAMAEIARELPSDVPLHIHLSEQPRENLDCLAAYGRTPTALLAELGLLTPRLNAVHATHLTDEDIRMLGEASVGVVMCPTTEADLGDGIGPARRLADAGAHLAIGSDQNAFIDPLLELRGLEYGERLASGQRGRFSPAQLWHLGGAGGYRALGLGAGADGAGAGIAVGEYCDLVELDPSSLRTSGAEPAQLPMVATASDVTRVIVGGRAAATPVVE
ncbi:MAG: formimidoylglutamate deiminase [Microbacteriaceae bacterium]|nr:MAG: formimidoylglutamate deiminase [Microbacteriaceae bacterium]